ncbi:MAG: hypothetical protein A2173_08230 [Planctomycetes bacterium RBG_13_44_8b]|nr:MAG: hypothetical protein A2173_08230 [Planctomycetes bacterium RBG_13_44_8b]
MAALLLTIAIVPILKGLTQTNLNSVIIQRRTQSLCLAQEKLNRIKAAALYNFENDLTETGIELSTSYLCNVSQTVVNTNLKAISISVGYDQDNDRSLSPDEVEVTLQTQIAKRW